MLPTAAANSSKFLPITSSVTSTSLFCCSNMPLAAIRKGWEQPIALRMAALHLSTSTYFFLQSLSLHWVRSVLTLASRHRCPARFQTTPTSQKSSTLHAANIISLTRNTITASIIAYGAHPKQPRLQNPRPCSSPRRLNPLPSPPKNSDWQQMEETYQYINRIGNFHCPRPLRNINHSCKMLSAIPPALLVLLALLSLARAATNGYSTFELVPSASQAPLYPLGNFNVGQSVSFTLLLTDPASYASFDLSPTHFLIQLVRDDKITVIKSFSSGTPVCAASSRSCSLSYRIPSGQAGSLNLRIQGVPPTQDIDFLVAYDLSARVGGAVVRYSDFLRSHAMQLVYIESAQDYVVQLVSNTGSSSISVEVWKMAESPSKYKVDSAVAVTSAVVETNLTKFTAAIVTPGYYAIRVVVNSNPSFQRIRLIFSSDQYACPFSPSSTDKSRVYTGCVLPKSEPGLPCLNYNTLTKECTFCIAGYEVVNGRCNLLNPCGTRQFSHFGRCRDADPTCLTFDPFTGDCLTCNPTHELLSGKCELKILICGERQWKSNGTCSNASDSCLTFDGNTGNCLTCRVGALPAGPVCLQSVLNCSLNEYELNSTCVPVPESCALFDHSTQLCSICAFGFQHVESICQEIQCPSGRVLSKVSQRCEDATGRCRRYDWAGKCLECTDKHWKVVEGKCLKMVHGLAACRDREVLGFGKCVHPEENCRVYNLRRGECERCQEGFYLNYQGKCRADQICYKDRLSINGDCLQRPHHCRLIDNATALCLQCDQPHFTLLQGICVKTPHCSPRKFKTPSGDCVDVSEKCGDYNPTSGKCITCKAGDLPQNGVCCGVGMAWLKGRCVGAELKTLPTSDCLAVHPTMGYCIVCAEGYVVNSITMQDCLRQ